ncbi:MAG TPA: DNA-directed RNA polymerase subunit alpha C-terminal domain-containing protein [Pyrinomonadaceae bacterium]
MHGTSYNNIFSYFLETLLEDKSNAQNALIELHYLIENLHSEDVFRSIENIVSNAAENRNSNISFEDLQTEVLSSDPDPSKDKPATDFNAGNSESSHANGVEFLEIIQVPETVRNLPVNLLPLSVRLGNILEALGIRLFGDLHGMTFDEFQSTRNCGRTTVSELTLLLREAQRGKFDNFVERSKTETFVDNFANRIAEQTEEAEDYESEMDFLYLENCLYIPQKFKEVPLEQFSLSVRALNVLNKLEMLVLGDLQRLSFIELARTRNCGRKTVDELRKFVQQVQRAGDGESEGAKLRKLPKEDVAGEVDFKIPAIGLTLPELLAFINRFLDELPTNKKDVLLYRYGGGADERVLTLEEIAAQQNLTRERIRQIQAKEIKKLYGRLQYVAADVLNQIYAACLNAVSPLTPHFLVFLTKDDYSVFQYPPSFYVRILEELKSGIPVWVEKQTIPISQLREKAAILSDRIKNYLETRHSFVTFKEVFENVMRHSESSEISVTDFFEAVCTSIFVIEPGESPDTLLISLNKAKLTMIEIARHVLSQSDKPLTPEEIIERGKQLFSPETEMPAPNSLANLPGYDSDFYLLDRRTIGLRQHFRLPNELWEVAKNDFYHLLKQNQRTYSTIEVIASRLFHWTKLTNSSELAQILREDERFKDLGRFNFALDEWQIEEREQIKDLTVKILEQANHPLTSTEIGERILQFRSASLTSLPNFLRNHEKVKACGFGFYGLKEWQNDFTDFFVGNQKAINAMIKQGQSLAFGDLCEQIGIAPTDELADKLWQTLKAMPKMRIKSADKSPDAIIKRVKWVP